METSPPPPQLPLRPGTQQIVTLNVGGTRYETTLDTLRSVPSTFLDAITRHQSTKEPIFIDRDAECFKYILRYLRDGRPPVIPNELPLVDQLLREAEFYCIPDLIAHLSSLYDQLRKQDTQQQDADRQMKRKTITAPVDPTEGTGSPMAKRTFVVCCEHAGRNLEALLSSEADDIDCSQLSQGSRLGDRVFSTDEDF